MPEKVSQKLEAAPSTAAIIEDSIDASAKASRVKAAQKVISEKLKKDLEAKADLARKNAAGPLKN